MPLLPPATQDLLHGEAGFPFHDGTFTRKTSATYLGAQLIMVKTNLAQHEQHLKSLETSLREICERHKHAQEGTQDTWGVLTEIWSMIMKLFVIIEDLRLTRLELEKGSQDS